jgi:hypothetical protein
LRPGQNRVKEGSACAAGGVPGGRPNEQLVGLSCCSSEWHVVSPSVSQSRVSQCCQSESGQPVSASRVARQDPVKVLFAKRSQRCLQRPAATANCPFIPPLPALRQVQPSACRGGGCRSGAFAAHLAGVLAAARRVRVVIGSAVAGVLAAALQQQKAVLQHRGRRNRQSAEGAGRRGHKQQQQMLAAT